jgi:glycosyltransferase involved in cell wall biosynthesis
MRTLDFFSSQNIQYGVVCWTRSTENQQIVVGPIVPMNYGKKSLHGRGGKNLFKQITWQLFQARKLIFHRIDIVYSCDLDTYLIALALKPIKRYRIIFDQFDPYESRFNSGIARKLVNNIESLVIRFADIYIVPSYKRIMNSHPRTLVIPNTTTTKTVNSTVEFKKPYLFYGGTLGRDRGILTAINAIKKQQELIFVIAGFGELEKTIRKLQDDRIIYLGKKTPEQIMNLTQQATLILGTYDPRPTNNRNSASNKISEAAIAGVPIIVSRGTGSEVDVERYQLGVVINHDIPEELSDAIRNLKIIMARYKKNLRDSYLSKSREEDKSNELLEMIQEILD